jgi:hypothetical protein
MPYCGTVRAVQLKKRFASGCPVSSKNLAKWVRAIGDARLNIRRHIHRLLSKILKKCDSGKEITSGCDASKLCNSVVPDRGHPTKKIRSLIEDDILRLMGSKVVNDIF